MATESQKEVWTGEVLRKFRSMANFLGRIPDRSNLVNNRVIHITDLGADPAVYINNTTYPIPVQDNSDTDVAITLDKFDTGNTAVPDDDLYAASYAIITEVSDVHSETLKEKTSDKAIHAIAPQETAAKTPIIATTGKTDGGASARAKITIADIIKLKNVFDINKVPQSDRILVLHPNHCSQLLEIVENFKDQYQNLREGQILRLFGFDVYEYPTMPVYNGSLVKKSFGSVAAPSTDCYASVAFYAPRMFKAMDKMTMYLKEAKDDPIYRSTTVGFRTYFIALPKKAEAYASIVSTTTIAS